MPDYMVLPTRKFLEQLGPIPPSAVEGVCGKCGEAVFFRDTDLRSQMVRRNLQPLCTTCTGERGKPLTLNPDVSREELRKRLSALLGRPVTDGEIEDGFNQAERMIFGD